MRHTRSSGARALITRSLAVAAAAVLAAGLAQPSAGAAHRAKAPALACGDTVTTDVVLTRNLTCTADALTVAAPGVTVDLGGHRITGTGTGAGIRLEPPAEEVTVRHGRISGFELGVQAWFGPVRLERMTLTRNGIGVEARSGPARVAGSTFRDNGWGLVHASSPAHVTGSTFRDNRGGISCGNATLVVEASRFTDNALGVSADVCGVLLSDSRFSGGRTAASVARSGGFPVDVRGNTFRGAVVGVHLRGAVGGSRVVSDNVFRDNGASGLVIDTDDLQPTAPFEVARNTFRGNGFAPGGETVGGRPLTAGLWARAGTLTGNQARGNAGHGIEAYGVVDGGGNRARNNGADPQCLGVVCTR